MRRQMTKLAAVATAAALACSMFTFPGSSLAYAKTARTSQFDSATGSSDVTGLTVPTLAYDDTSITVVWEKPEKYDNVADYNVYINGKLAGTARQNFKEHADWAASYMESFYKGYENSSVDMVDVDIHSFKAANLTPETEYTFVVKPIDKDGKELGTSKEVKQSTTATKAVFNIADYGAKTSEAYTTYNDEINTFIEDNTKAIQSAIDACTKDGKVVIPAGTYVTGALYLKSDMTLELEEGALLWGSPNSNHYEHNYLLYPYSTDTRAWSLLNAYSSDEEQPYENIRITGEGTINGNGWKYYDTAKKVSSTSVIYQAKDKLDPTDSKYNLEMWYPNGKTSIADNAVLAADAFTKGKAQGLNDTTAYATRPNLVTLRGVNGIYIEGISVKNPAFHTIAILDSENVVSNDVKYITNDCNNADGIEISNTKNATIFNSFFDTGDDSINFATGLGNGVGDTKQQASETIWTFNNFIRNGHGGAIAAGSHTGAGICDMLVEDNVINLNQMPFRFKSAPVNGGGAYDVIIRDCAVANCQQLFVMTTTYGDANQAFAVEPADKPAEFRDIKAYNITADGIAKNTFYLNADVGPVYKTWHTHHDLYFKDITCTNIAKKSAEYIRGCEDVTFNNVTVTRTASGSTDPWASITYSKNIQFDGTTTEGSFNKNAMSAPQWSKEAACTATSAVVAGTEYDTASMKLSWTEASDNVKVTSYSVDVYVNGEKVDQIDDLTTNTKEITGLSTGVEYTFKVYASDVTGNKTEGPSVTATTAGEKDTKAIKTVSDNTISFSGTGYTWSLAKFTNARKNDTRVRGYRVYVNDQLSDTFYIYNIQDASSSDTIAQNVRRLTAGKENKVKIVAFTDAGLTSEYKEASVMTTENYDFKAPVWGEEAKLTVTKVEDKLVLSWPAATDESAILGYRVYVDGTPVTNNNQTFNQVNGNYTTADTTYTVTGLDLTKEHTFKVEAGDNWWKATNGSGPFHWTLSGPSVTYQAEPVAPATEAPATEAPATEAPATEAPATEAPATQAPVTQAPVTPVAVGQVANVKAQTSATTATISWSKVNGAAGYEVSYKDAAGKTVTKKVTATSLKITGLAPNTAYSVMVKAYAKDQNTTVYGKESTVTAKTTTLKVSTLTASNVTNSAINLNWKKANEAAGYVITYKNACGKKTTVTMKKASMTTATIKNLLANTSYKFTIRPYVMVNGKQVMGESLTKAFKTAKTVKPAKVTVSSVKKASKKSIKVSVKKQKAAAGYEVSYSLKKKSGYKSVDVKSNTKATISKLKSGQTYYVKVRAYTYENKVVKGKVVKKKVYGSYSTVKTVKLK